MDIRNENIDHIYCNNKKNLPCFEKTSLFIGDNLVVKKMKKFILSNLNLIEELQNQIQERDSFIAKLLAENENLKGRLTKKKSLFREDILISSNKNNTGNNKSKFSEKKDEDEENFNKKPSEDSQESISIKLSNKNLFLITNKEYLINDWKYWKMCDFEENPKGFGDINLEVPLWELASNDSSSDANPTEMPMEDITDEAFNKRHLKYEIDERRRKKWEMQNWREQKNIERLRKRHNEYAETASVNAKIPKKMTSFFPDIEAIKFIQISDNLPICSFGEQIPKLQTRDFSLPWLSEHDFYQNIYSIEGNPKMKVRTKFIKSSK